VSSPPSTAESILREWDLELEIEDGRLGGGGIASGIRGSVALVGENTPNGPMAFGTLDLKALAIKEIAVTGVQGPFAFNRRELLFGRDAAAWKQKNNLPSLDSITNNNPVASAVFLNPAYYPENRPVVQASHRGPVRDALSSRIDSLGRVPAPPPLNPNAVRVIDDVVPIDRADTDIRARSLSGTVFLSGTEPLDGQQRSNYRLRLVAADLQGFLVDLGESNTQAKGELSIECDLQGELTNTASLGGQGRAWLRKANLYELPAMIKLFRVLSVSPGQGAFDSADILFGIDGDRLPVHKLVLDGDIVSLRGEGWVNMRRELHFDLSANVGRRSLVGSVFRPLSSSPAATLLQLEVNGTTTEPQIRRRSISLMNTLEKGRAENANEYQR